MNLKVVLYTISKILIIFALSLLIPLGVSFLYRDEGILAKAHETYAFLITIGLSLGISLLLRIIFASARQDEIDRREGFAIVSFSWVVITFLGALPYYLSEVIPSFTDAYFETMSGFTTTGASILERVESLPHGLLFWRSFTHFLGGIGIIILALAILPALGVGGYHLFRLESSGGIIATKIKPRFSQVARILFRVYLLLNCLLVICLLIGGMSLFDAFCHAFGTIATGGFSTRTNSLADPQLNSTFITYVIIIFMFLSACSFYLHYYCLSGRLGEIKRDPQLKYYLIFIISAVIITTVSLSYNNPGASLADNFNQACFQVVSIGTCTGFTITDFNRWPEMSKFLLLILMLIGGCAGSTTGAIKQIRIIILAKIVWRGLTQLIRPRQIIPIKINNIPVDQEILDNIVVFFILYIVTLLVATLILTVLGLDIISASSAVISTMGGVGPGLGSVAANYSTVPLLGKWVLCFCMLAGRLELFGVLILLNPLTWKR